eukprot:sb/3478178/
MIEDLFLSLAPMTSQPKFTIPDRNNPCVLLTPTKYQQFADLYCVSKTQGLFLSGIVNFGCDVMGASDKNSSSLSLLPPTNLSNSVSVHSHFNKLSNQYLDRI